MTSSRRSLCGAADIKGWSRRLVPEQIRAQQALIDVTMAACRRAKLPEEIVQSSGDGILILPPSDIDESAVIPDLINGLETALRQENRLLSADARIRLRFALTSGLVTPGPAGFSGSALIECFRLLDSPPARAALHDFPEAQLAVIVSDHLYRDVISNGYRDLRAERFWPVRGDLPEKEFAANAWVYVSDRTSGPEVPLSPDPANPLPSGELAKARALLAQGRPGEVLDLLNALPMDGETRPESLDVRAEARFLLGHYQQAQEDLAEFLNLCPDTASGPAGSALLRLGRCQERLGDTAGARHTWLFLLEHRPSTAEAHLELGRLERRARKYATAQTHLVEGLRLVRTAGDPDVREGVLDDLLQELADIPAIDH